MYRLYVHAREYVYMSACAKQRLSTLFGKLKTKITVNIYMFSLEAVVNSSYLLKITL